MFLRPPTKGSRPKRAGALDGRTTLPGSRNQHGQEVIGRTGAPSTSHPNQIIHHMKCRRCKKEYGANGCDTHLRRCPFCSGGKAGEPLPAASPSLFD